MIYVVDVLGLNTENKYYHSCDLIKAESFTEMINYVVNYRFKGWTFTRIEVEILKENQFIVFYYDILAENFQLFKCTADSETEAIINFRIKGDFADTKRYTIITVKGVKK